MIRIFPQDSSGKLCGIDAKADKPYLIFFDLTACVKRISSAWAGCPTRQACVKECPDEFYTFKETEPQDKAKEKLKPYCSEDISSVEYANRTVAYLLRVNS